METTATDEFTLWGLDADWPERRWLEPVHGRDYEPARGTRLGHASDSAMVLTCTFPRSAFDLEAPEGESPTRDIAYETTYALVNLALHQIKAPGARPDGLIASLLSHAMLQAGRYSEWPVVQWGDAAANTTELASWQSGFSLDYPGVYVIVHACGVAIDSIRLHPVDDLSGYEVSEDPLAPGVMHWELWPSRSELDYEELTRTLVH